MKRVDEQMAFYDAYHRHPLNKATHFIGIPTIIFSILVVLGWARVPVGGFTVTAAMATVAVLLGYYFALDRALAVGMALFLLPALWMAEQVSQWSYAAGGAVFLVFFVGGWVFQLIGHGVYEKRRPALVDNLFQMIIGPFFLVAEVFFLLGLKHDLRDRVREGARRHLPERAAAS